MCLKAKNYCITLKIKQMETKDFLQRIPMVKLTYSDPDYRERPQIRSSLDIRTVIEPFYTDCMQHHEEMYALLLSHANRVSGVVKLGEGDITGVVINRQALYQAMVLSNSMACILVHNHPSGNLRPSCQDDAVTKEISQAVKILGYRLLDHIIITSDSYFSYADEGRL
jgi:DNA repair protein RadC